MNDTIKWLLLGVGGYLLYDYLTAPAAAATVATTTGAMPAAATSTTAPPAQPAAPLPSTPMTTAQYLQQMGYTPVVVAAQSSGQLPANQMLTASQWNWFLKQVSNITNDPLDAYLPAGQGTNSDTPISVQTWWTALLQWAGQNPALSSACDGACATLAGLGDLAGLSSLGYRDASANFAQPPATGAGRFDFVDEGWA